MLKLMTRVLALVSRSLTSFMSLCHVSSAWHSYIHMQLVMYFCRCCEGSLLSFITWCVLKTLSSSFSVVEYGESKVWKWAGGSQPWKFRKHDFEIAVGEIFRPTLPLPPFSDSLLINVSGCDSGVLFNLTINLFRKLEYTWYMWKVI